VNNARSSDIQIEACRLFAEAMDRQDEGRLAEAEALYTVAAELGYPLAMNNLAILLEDVIATPRPAEAAYWLKRAVACGYNEAAWNLAMRQRQAGNRRWYIHWLRIAAEMDHEEAADILPVATTSSQWWAIEGVSPPPFARETPFGQA
jgi:TPR repeat protein